MTFWMKKSNNSAEPSCKILKKTHGINYISDLLDEIDLPKVKMKDVLTTNTPCFYLRHDVDHEIDMALAMGQAEYEAGYSSTYFLLTPGSYAYDDNYYGSIENGRIKHHEKLVDHCRRLIDLGHDIGFHNDLFALSFRMRRAPGDILEEEVEFFRKNGIPMVGTAAHGNPLTGKLEYRNMEIFEGCVRKKWEPNREIEYNGWKVQTHSLKLEDYGFLYEAYSLPRDSRLSDSGSRWRGKIAGAQLDWPEFNANFDMSEFKRFLHTARPENGVKHFTIMTHPNHWAVQ
jgi:hypothetical protein